MYQDDFFMVEAQGADAARCLQGLESMEAFRESNTPLNDDGRFAVSMFRSNDIQFDGQEGFLGAIKTGAGWTIDKIKAFFKAIWDFFFSSKGQAETKDLKAAVKEETKNSAGLAALENNPKEAAKQAIETVKETTKKVALNREYTPVLTISDRILRKGTSQKSEFKTNDIAMGIKKAIATKPEVVRSISTANIDESALAEYLEQKGKAGMESIGSKFINAFKSLKRKLDAHKTLETSAIALGVQLAPGSKLVKAIAKDLTPASIPSNINGMMKEIDDMLDTLESELKAINKNQETITRDMGDDKDKTIMVLGKPMKNSVIIKDAVNLSNIFGAGIQAFKAVMYEFLYVKKSIEDAGAKKALAMMIN